jgi:hypothetical protein
MSTPAPVSIIAHVEGSGTGRSTPLKAASTGASVAADGAAMALPDGAALNAATDRADEVSNPAKPCRRSRAQMFLRPEVGIVKDGTEVAERPGAELASRRVES